MQHLKRVISLLMVLLILISFAAAATVNTSASGTGIGLSEWALNAYYSGWSYVYGGSKPGAVDCSGLIYSYAGGHRNNFEPYTDYIGYVSNGIPNIHGLGLSTPNHYGVYVGNGMAVDARGSDYGVVYQSVYSRRWDQYFKIPGISYPTTGWEVYNGEYYYYENGEYITDTSRTIDGITYYFASSGVSDKVPGTTTETAYSEVTEAPQPSEVPATDAGYSNSVPEPTDPPEEITNPETEPNVETEEETETEDTPTEEETVYKLGDSNSEIADIQQRLSDLKYYNGKVDGVFDELTETALMEFQKNNGLYGTGTADSFSIMVLNLERASEAPTEAEEIEEPVSEEPTQQPSTLITAGISEISTEITSGIIMQTANFSAKALANLTSGAEVTNLTAPSDNLDFMKWFIVVLATMGISFAIAMTIEKVNEKRAKVRRKKAAARYKGTHLRKK